MLKLNYFDNQKFGRLFYNIAYILIGSNENLGIVQLIRIIYSKIKKNCKLLKNLL